MSELFNRMWVRLSLVADREDGQAITEYALILALVVGIAVTLAFSGLGDAIGTKLSDLSTKITGS